MRSGFVAVVGRPNVGKSTLVNCMVGTKISIVSSRPNTTRYPVRGVLHRTDAQVVFVDTPGIHRPRSALGERLNDAADASLDGVDVVVVVVDATAALGPGDRTAIARALDAPGSGTEEAPPVLVVVNKVDLAGPDEVMVRLASAAEAVTTLAGEGGRQGVEPVVRPAVEYFPVSATTGRGVAALADEIVARLPDGPPYYPPDMVTDAPEVQQVAELVREQLLARVRDELPHSIACRVTEWEWPRIRCEILVERDSQKAIVVGRGGEVLKAVGTAVRRQLPPGAYLELHVKVERRWQQRDDVLDRLGY